MSSKPKALLKQSKHKQRKEQVLNTADDYQAAGVDFEDAAGKWRAGDAVKSMRFFHRALEVYEQGLQRFPQNFDLAYNRARVQLEIATHPILVNQLQEPILIVLKTALNSHRYALDLDRNNADTLFNTAQVLTSIAEELAKQDTFDDTEAVRYLEEALELQNRCLSLQELRYEEHIEQQQQAAQQAEESSDIADDDDNEDGGAPVEASKEQEERWFSIVEPVTRDTLIDTAIAQLGTLTTLCSILNSSSTMVSQANLAWIEDYSSSILNKRLPYFVENDSDRLLEIALVRANFVSALLEAGFRAGRLDAPTYKRERDAIFAVPELALETSAEGLIANARSLMSFNTTLAELEGEQAASSVVSRWNAASAAATNLVTASKLTGLLPEDLAKTHLLRGDCSMLQHQMGFAPTNYQSAISNAPQLLKNAEVFYRNASKLSLNQHEKLAASFRSAFAQYLQQNDISVLTTASQGRGESWIRAEIDDMINEGLLPEKVLISLNNIS